VRNKTAALGAQEDIQQGLNQDLELEAADGQGILEEPVTRNGTKRTDNLHSGFMGASATFDRTASTNWVKKKTIDDGDEMMDVAGMQQQTVYIGLEHHGDHVNRGPSTAQPNDLSAGSVGVLAI
jgi:hypothetical protein